MCFKKSHNCYLGYTKEKLLPLKYESTTWENENTFFLTLPYSQKETIFYFLSVRSFLIVTNVSFTHG